MEFSVLMSIYHKERVDFFKDAVDSILNQTRPPTELLLVKDGPVGGDLDQAIDDYVTAHPNIMRVIALSENQGLGEALRVGVENCKFDLIARMDTDDIAHPDRFALQLLAFDDDPSLDLVGGHITEFDERPTCVTARRIMPLTQKDIHSYARRRNPFNHVTVMFRKRAVLAAGNYKAMHGAGFEDYSLWLRMLKNQCRCANLDQVLVSVRTGRDMFARRGGLKYLVGALRFRRDAYRMGFASLVDTLVADAANVIVSIAPQWVRRYIYMRYLRQ